LAPLASERMGVRAAEMTGPAWSAMDDA